MIKGYTAQEMGEYYLFFLAEKIGSGNMCQIAWSHKGGPATLLGEKNLKKPWVGGGKMKRAALVFAPMLIRTKQGERFSLCHPNLRVSISLTLFYITFLSQE